MQPQRLLLCLAMATATASYNVAGRQTIVVAAPTRSDPIYANVWRTMAGFLGDYAAAVVGTNVDNFVILGDAQTLQLIQRLKPSLPRDVFLEGAQEEPWMRDFTAVRPSAPVAFQYRPRYHRRGHASSTQNTFRRLLNQCRIPLRETHIVMDGGNLVDNDLNMGIVTERIYADNPRMNRQALKAAIERETGLGTISVIPEYPDDTTGHADGMVSFLDANTVALTDLYPMTDRVRRQLRRDLGSSVRFIELENSYVESKSYGFDTACGLHVNLLATDGALYVPVFGGDGRNRGQSAALDRRVLGQIRGAIGNRKRVVPVEVPNAVCSLGGNVRCLSWQVKGAISDALVGAAQGGRCGR